jgi:hypothetical protein
MSAISFSLLRAIIDSIVAPSGATVLTPTSLSAGPW